jgi:hypothetical protein
MFNIEGLETLLTTLAFISAAVSVYGWYRAPAIPSLPGQPSTTLEWLDRSYARVGSAAAVALFFLALLMASHLIEAMSGTVPASFEFAALAMISPALRAKPLSSTGATSALDFNERFAGLCRSSERRCRFFFFANGRFGHLLH